ncbi:hypothetical protein Btru_031604 [Bulinus truncatus]|nr:hypothetical protein Btru_031604 [Bulinus truncatus]
MTTGHLVHCLNVLVTVYIFKVTSLDLVIEPRTIQPGLTQRLLVNCSVSKDSDPKAAFMNSVVLSRRVVNTTDRFVELASITTYNKNVVVYDAGVTVSGGDLNNNFTGVSYLSLQWAHPVQSMEGEYRCAANGMGLAWRPVTASVSEVVITKALDFADVANQMRSIQIQQDLTISEVSRLKIEIVKKNQEIVQLQMDLKQANSIAANFMNKSITTLETSRNWFFEISPVYKGRRYYLSQQDPITYSEQAMATCVMYGGYLAEIEDMEEFSFVVTFIQQFSGFNLILIGGVDGVKKGVWTYRTNNSTVPDWLMKLRKNNPDFHCLYLYSGVKWYAIDFLCAVTSDLSRYICEIPLAD